MTGIRYGYAIIEFGNGLLTAERLCIKSVCVFDCTIDWTSTCGAASLSVGLAENEHMNSQSDKRLLQRIEPRE